MQQSILESHPLTQETHVMCVQVMNNNMDTQFDRETLKKWPFGRRWNWRKDIKIDLIETWRGGMDWIHLAQNMDKWQTPLNKELNHLVPQNAGNFLTS
jgi:hypothetical protein